MVKKYSTQGVSLVEIMVAIAIIAILTSIAIPAYTRYAQKALRHEAIADLLKIQLIQEHYRNYNASYGTETQLATYNGGSLPITSTTGNYTITVTDSTGSGNPTTTSYAIQATAVGNQANDSEQGSSCATLMITEQGTKTPSVCW